MQSREAGGARRPPATLVLPAAAPFLRPGMLGQAVVVNTPVYPDDVPLTLVMTNWNR
jgi:hypothetical protein